MTALCHPVAQQVLTQNPAQLPLQAMELELTQHLPEG